jgi:FtsH-binding integral membrane protein
MKNNQAISVLSLLALATLMMIIRGINQPLTANQYVTNTYMYILLEIIIVGGVWLSMDSNQSTVDSNPWQVDSVYSSGWNIMGLIVLTFASLCAVIAIPSERIVIQHVALLSFVLLIGAISYVSYRRSVANNTIRSILMSLIALVATLSYIAMTQPLDTFDNWIRPMTMMLGLIFVQTFDYLVLFDGTGDFITRNKIYSWIGMGLFSGFLLYDTQHLIKQAKRIAEICRLEHLVKSISQTAGIHHIEPSSCTNYPVQSLNIFLDIANLFSDMSAVSQ